MGTTIDLYVTISRACTMYHQRNYHKDILVGSHPHVLSTLAQPRW